MIVDCPSCTRKLRIPDSLLGKLVKCPTCNHNFTAQTAAAATEEASTPTAAWSAPEPSKTGEDSVEGFAAPPASSPPSPNMRPCPHCGALADLDARRCAGCGGQLDEYDPDEERPWDPATRPGRLDAEPHRGTAVLVLGILSLVLGPIGLVLGIAAWVMGQRDLKKMRTLMMDPLGQGTTQAGMICGIIGTVLQSLSVLLCMGYMAFAITMVGAMKMAPRPNVGAPPGQTPPAFKQKQAISKAKIPEPPKKAPADGRQKGDDGVERQRPDK
jgi:predicted Zn finger-like uncharacterized protein